MLMSHSESRRCVKSIHVVCLMENLSPCTAALELHLTSFVVRISVQSDSAAVNNLISNDWHFSPSGSIYIIVLWIPVTPPPPLCDLMFDLLEEPGP